MELKLYNGTSEEPSPTDPDSFYKLNPQQRSVMLAGVVAGADGLHRYRWFPNAPRAFGHHGAGGQLCWCDPDTGLSFTFLHDTHHRDPSVTLLRTEDLNSLALECVQP
jgi:CubicO group peptidase (beta-lactamase class C family)